MFNDFKSWSAEVTRRGYSFELNGTGKMIAHLDGDEKGIWDGCYGGCGAGWFY